MNRGEHVCLSVSPFSFLKLSRNLAQIPVEEQEAHMDQNFPGNHKIFVSQHIQKAMCAHDVLLCHFVLSLRLMPTPSHPFQHSSQQE